MINKQSFQELQTESFEYLLNNTSITQISPGGVARSLVDITNQHLAEFYDTLDTDMSMAFLSTSNGFFLDLIGKMFGVTRQQREQTTILRNDKMIKFYSGTAGSALSKFLPALVIPQGTTITNTSGTVTYTVTRNEEFSATATEVFVSAESTVGGVVSNIGANLLSTHSLGNSSILVTNIVPIFSGRDTETDDQYRSRITASSTAAQTSNETAIRLATLSVPGVADIQIKPFLRGSGTFDIFVIPQGNRVPRQTIESIRSRIGEVAAFGVSFNIRELDYIPMRIETTARFTPRTLDGEKSILLTQAEQQILTYLGNIRPGGELIINQIRSIIIDSDPSIIDSDVVFLCVNKRAQIIRNFRIEEDELLIPDDDHPNPVIVRQA